MKVILSRKGFDSKAGGDYSPFDPKTRQYIVLPIPVGAKEKSIINPLKYENIILRANSLPDHSESNLRELMDKLGIKPKIKNELSYDAHFDPWLGSCPWLAEESNHHIGAFGQVGAAQSHLVNQKVGKDSIFLFFSRFKPLVNQKWEDEYFGISYEHAKEGLYFIYGWLRVEELVAAYEDNLNLKGHPHFTEKYFEEKHRNTIYVSHKCGYFPKLSNELLLTANDAQQTKQSVKWISSRWSLKSCFYKNLTHTNDKQWTPVDDITKTCMVAPQGPGQEYVFRKDGNQQAAEDWANDLIKS